MKKHLWYLHIPYFLFLCDLFSFTSFLALPPPVFDLIIAAYRCTTLQKSILKMRHLDALKCFITQCLFPISLNLKPQKSAIFSDRRSGKWENAALWSQINHQLRFTAMYHTLPLWQKCKSLDSVRERGQDEVPNDGEKNIQLRKRVWRAALENTLITNIGTKCFYCRWSVEDAASESL